MTTKSPTIAGFYEIYRLTYDAPILFCVVPFKTSLQPYFTIGATMGNGIMGAGVDARTLTND